MTAHTNTASKNRALSNKTDSTKSGTKMKMTKRALFSQIPDPKFKILCAPEKDPTPMQRMAQNFNLLNAQAPSKQYS